MLYEFAGLHVDGGGGGVLILAGEYFGGGESLLPDSSSFLTLTAIQLVVELPSMLLLLELSIFLCMIWKTRGPGSFIVSWYHMQVIQIIET